jgi:hypothetical protein
MKTIHLKYVLIATTLACDALDQQIINALAVHLGYIWWIILQVKEGSSVLAPAQVDIIRIIFRANVQAVTLNASSALTS